MLNVSWFEFKEKFDISVGTWEIVNTEGNRKDFLLLSEAVHCFIEDNETDERPEIIMLMERESGKLIGFLTLFTMVDQEAHINYMEILEGYRHIGLGGHMLRFALSFALSIGCKGVHVMAANLDAVRLIRASKDQLLDWE